MDLLRERIQPPLSVSRNAAAGASMGDSLAEPRALAYASRTAYVSHA